MINYLIISGAFWAGAFLFYHFLLRKKTFHRLNRIYLLSTLLFGLFLPFIELPSVTESPFFVTYLEPVTITIGEFNPEVADEVQPQKYFSIKGIFQFIYLGGVLFILGRMLVGYFNIRRLAKQSQEEAHIDYRLFLTSDPRAPFSFFNQIFISEEDRNNPAILNHELAHARGKHTLDNIITQFLSALFWFNPVIWFYDRALKETHEYIADVHALNFTRKKEYSYMLIGQASPIFNTRLASSFHSQTKKRIDMMFKRRSRGLAYFIYPAAFTFAIMLSTFILASCQNKAEEFIMTPDMEDVELIAQKDTIITFNADTFEEKVEIVEYETKVYKNVDMRPIIKSCENAGTKAEQLKCSDDKLQEYLINTVKFPEGKEESGKVILKFLVDENGYLSQPEIIYSFDEAYNQEVINAFNLLRKNHKWLPATVGAKAVGYYYQIPVIFKME